ncbi:MAG: RecQ family ATP-dependent DNA helicase, partial [Oscillospiraceae bacterium]|nr:RecQ family ATP-dependent DNA helicase [Oscillospiraceae bacterium]
MDKQTVLRERFGYSSFRDGQEPLIDAILAGRDAFGVMPTGGGKSLCYQIPALLLEGLTLVVSPLISLMKDQVAALKEAGIPAAFLNSSLTAAQQREALRRAELGAYRLIYVAPERLLTDSFLQFAEGQRISLLAVDEAHCVSQWGQDFRPNYLDISTFVHRLPQRPVLAAFTATATAQVGEDIVRLLELREPLRIVTGFDRPNLYFDVRRERGKLSWLEDYLSTHRDKSGIVYCATRKTVEQVCANLQAVGFAATRYHAGLDDAERRQNQDDFAYDRATVMVATNAFGMGIDKSNVRFVIHYNMPKNIESYYQEAGRAGRDGAPAECILLFSAGDVITAEFLIKNGSDREQLSEELRAELLARDMKRLQQMKDYCNTTGCYRAALLDYFGEQHRPNCGNCGNCVEAETVV